MGHDLSFNDNGPSNTNSLWSKTDKKSITAKVIYFLLFLSEELSPEKVHELGSNTEIQFTVAAKS